MGCWSWERAEVERIGFEDEEEVEVEGPAGVERPTNLLRVVLGSTGGGLELSILDLELLE